MMLTIKKNWVYFLFAIALLVFVISKIKQNKQSTEIKPAAIEQKKDSVFVELKTIKTGFGWGYEIYKNKQLFIRQEYIPALEGRIGFVNEEQAKKIGNWVIQRMTQGRMQLPAITPKEIDSLGITH